MATAFGKNGPKYDILYNSCCLKYEIKFWAKILVKQIKFFYTIYFIGTFAYFANGLMKMAALNPINQART